MSLVSLDVPNIYLIRSEAYSVSSLQKESMSQRSYAAMPISPLFCCMVVSMAISSDCITCMPPEANTPHMSSSTTASSGSVSEYLRPILTSLFPCRSSSRSSICPLSFSAASIESPVPISSTPPASTHCSMASMASWLSLSMSKPVTKSISSCS